MSRIVIEVVTPEKQVFFDTVDEVSLPAQKGYLTVLPGHTPALVALGTGILVARDGGANREERLVVSGGVAEIGENRVILLADIARRAGDVNPAAAKADLAAGESLMLKGDTAEVAAGRRQSALATASLEVSGSK